MSLNLKKKVYYRCNLAKFKGNQCEAGIYLLYCSDNEEVHLFRSKNEHTHNLNLSKKVIDPEVEKIIDELIHLHIKPKRIFEVLHEKNIAEEKIPSLNCLRNYLNR